MIYQELTPDPALQSSVACFWTFRLEPSDPPSILHTIPPDGTVSLVWTTPPGMAILVGPRVAALQIEVHAGSLYTGVRLIPGAAPSLLGADVPSLRDRSLPLAYAVPNPDLARSFESAMRTLGESPTLDAAAPAMAAVLHRWLDNPAKPRDPVADQVIARLLAGEDSPAAFDGLSYRQVLRRFHQATGLTPKEFARLRRIRNACIQALFGSEHGDPAGWAAISADTGFADQSHLSREFSRTFGWPPRLVLEYLRRIDHRNVAV